jgi:hypothetical protein
VADFSRLDREPPPPLLETIGNLAEFHREHEKYYAGAPLLQAGDVLDASRILKALADHWSRAVPSEAPAGSPFAGARDLNPPGLTAEEGVLFMEGEGEPAELVRLRRDLANLADDLHASGAWMAEAMDKSWQIAGALAQYPDLADVLGERHRIIANDRLAAAEQQLAAQLIRRALDLLGALELAPPALRDDLAGERQTVGYLYSASELLDRASDLIVESAGLVHDNERRWRVFSERVTALIAKAEQ